MVKQTKSLVAAFIAERISEINKTQKQIARECGWPRANVLSMLKVGDMRLPLDKVGPLAKSLHVDPAYLFWLTLSEYAADTLEALVTSTRGSIALDPYERRLVEAYRSLLKADVRQDITISDGLQSVVVAMSDVELPQ